MVDAHEVARERGDYDWHVRMRATNSAGSSGWSSGDNFARPLEASEQRTPGPPEPPEPPEPPAPPPRPRVLGPWRVSVAEEGDTAVGAYTALFSGSRITPAWSLSGADAALFGISGDGALAFLEPPDHERPRDRDAAAPGDNVYVVTLNATADSGETGALTVRVTVTDAGGRFHIPPAAGALTAFTGSLAQFRDELTDTCPAARRHGRPPVRGGRAGLGEPRPRRARARRQRRVRGAPCRRLRLDAAARHSLRRPAARRVRGERPDRGARRRGPPRGRGLRRAGRRGVVALRPRRRALRHPRRGAPLRRAARPRVARRRRRRQHPPRHRRGGGGRRDGPRST